MKTFEGHYGVVAAITTAIDALETAHCVEGPPVEIAAAIETLQMILDQRGCEGWGWVLDNPTPTPEPACASGRLTDLMDVVIFG